MKAKKIKELIETLDNVEFMIGCSGASITNKNCDLETVQNDIRKQLDTFRYAIHELDKLYKKEDKNMDDNYKLKTNYDLLEFLGLEIGDEIVVPSVSKNPAIIAKIEDEIKIYWGTTISLYDFRQPLNFIIEREYKILPRYTEIKPNQIYDTFFCV